MYLTNDTVEPVRLEHGENLNFVCFFPFLRIADRSRDLNQSIRWPRLRMVSKLVWK